MTRDNLTVQEKIAFLDAVGRETAKVILAELRKIPSATTGDLLIAVEALVVHAFAAVGLTPGKEAKLLKQLRVNAMRRLALVRMRGQG